jgi:hypothetical protein
VRRISAWTALIALLVGTYYAPLFHVHSDGGESVVHAHLPEPEDFDAESVVHIEAPHSHASARSIDILTTVATVIIHFDAVIESTSFAPIEPQPSQGFVAAASPRAHAPPGLPILIPRAPPA